MLNLRASTRICGKSSMGCSSTTGANERRVRERRKFRKDDLAERLSDSPDLLDILDLIDLCDLEEKVDITVRFD